MDHLEVNSWVAAAQFTTTDYVPLRLGPSVVGWTSFLSQAKGKHNTKVVMEGKVYDFKVITLWTAMRKFELKDTELYWKAVGYLNHVILNLPSGSLDLTTDGHLIDYTERSTNTLYAALSNYFLLLEDYIQSYLNSKTPAKAIETILALDNIEYPIDFLHLLSWRGTVLNDLIEPSQMMFFISDSSEEPTTLGELDSFMDFVFLQAPLLNGNEICRFLPKNTFFLKAFSDEELSLGRTLFNQDCLNAYLEETGHQIDPHCDRVFFFGPADSCIADWIIGETITVSELHEFDVSLT